MPFLHVATDDGQVNDAFGLRRVFKATAADTGGVLTTFIDTVPPGAGPPLHIHKVETEQFRVLAGRLLFECDGARETVEPGALIVIPPGLPHGFCALGDTPAELLVTLTPGGIDGMFREVAAAGLKPPADMPRIAQIAARYNLEFVGPPVRP